MREIVLITFKPARIGLVLLIVKAYLKDTFYNLCDGAF